MFLSSVVPYVWGVAGCHGYSPISSSTRQHLVDSEDVEGVEPYSDVELIFPGELHHVLICTDAASLQGLAGQLLILVGHQMHTQWEVLHWSLLGPQVKDSDFSIWWWWWWW